MIEIQKNSIERIRVQVSEFKKKRYIDCRVYFEGDDGQYHPSKKGLTLNADLVDDVVAALKEAQKELESGK